MSTQFLIRLRGNNNTYQDLAGNTWNYRNGTPETADGRFGGKSLWLRNETKLRLTTIKDNKQLSMTEPFTFSFWAYLNSAYDYDTGGNFFTVRPYNVSEFNFCPSCILYCLVNPERDLHEGFFTPDPTLLNTWQHWAICGNGEKINIFCDGTNITPPDLVLLDMPLITTNYMEFDPRANDDWYIDDFCLIDECLWTKDFTPPTDYLELPKKIFLSAGAAYGIDTSGSFTKLTDDFAALTDTEKLEMMNNVKVETQPAIAQLETLAMPIKCVNFSVWGENLDCTITAIPTGQTITPKGLIPLIKYQKIRSVNITGDASGNGAVKIAVTKDNATYQVWDKDAEEWKPINISDIATKGMTLLEVSALSVSAWTALDAIESGIGFAYYLAMSATSDTAYTDEVTLNVELMGELKSLVQGRDYDYGYVANDVLQVKIYKNGDFRINYNPGPLNTKLKLPTISSSLMYNGEAQSPNFANYNPNKLQIGGEISGTNVGTYTATFTPAIGYTWEDDTTATKNVPWAIAKAESNLTLDTDNVSVAVGATSTVDATFDGGGVLTATAAEGNANVTIEGKNIIVAGVTEGADTITVSVADTTNYKGGSAEIAVTITAAGA